MFMSQNLTCWQCGNPLENVIFPMSRREICAVCDADQHVCKMCKEFDGRNSCNEPIAEDVTDREKANFCDYFSPSGEVFLKTTKEKQQNAKAQLAALFGVEPEVDNTSDESLTPGELAERKLREMLGD
ncbi:MAG: hypothetical protein ACI9MS_002149 [Glaciecola sp.]